MDTFLHMCRLTIMIVIVEIVYSDTDYTTVYIPDKTINRARCLSNCFDLFGVSKSSHVDIGHEQYPLKTCQTHACTQCLLPCDVTSWDKHCRTDVCHDDDACKSSCAFLSNIHKESSPAGDVTQPLTSAIVTPDIVCKNVPYGRNDCPGTIASIYIKWSFGPVVARPTPIFIVNVRLRNEWDKPSNWTVAKIVTDTFVELDHLRCSTDYQFQVTAVFASGLHGRSRPTVWSRTPGYNYVPSPPQNLNVSEPYLVNQKPSVTVTWDTGTEAPCYYKIFWFDQTVYLQAEIKVPRQFRYQIDNLKFSKNYTIRLYSIDEAFQHTSEDKRVYALTPDCLVATGYNHSVCAPEKPRNITLDILTSSHKDINVRFVSATLSWTPPKHTNNGRDVLRYILVYRKEPPYDVAKHLEPHKAELLINNSETSITLSDLHNHNLYSFELSAVTSGGKGDYEFIKKYIGLHVSDEVPGGQPDTSQHTQISSTNNLAALELLFVVLVPSVLFLTLIVAISCVVVRRRNYKRYPSQRKCGPVEEMNPIYDGMGLNIDSEKKAQFGLDGYEIEYSCLDFISVIGEGAFGKVVKAEYYPQPGDRGSGQGKIVAVKMLRDFSTGDESRNFVLEIQAMKNLGHSPYIVGIIGCCLTGPKLCLVMDYCALGDLRNYLRKYREKLMYTMSSQYGLMTKTSNCYMQDELCKHECETSNGSGISDIDENADVSEGQLISYARQVTMGMEFLEHRKFVHRDLAARNILLYDHRLAKLSDFGLTRDVYETNMYQPTSARKLPYKWMAIESLFSQRFTVKSDVWAFGIVLWEIVTLGGSPYPSIPLKDLYGLLNDGYRMEKPDNCSTKIYQIMLSCWHPNPHSRPTFSQLKTELEKLLEETISYIDLSVEVSEDYFNESTNESNAAGCPTTVEPRDTVSELESGNNQECLEAQKLYVDIHKQPKSTAQENTDGIGSCDVAVSCGEPDYLESIRPCEICSSDILQLSGKHSHRIIDDIKASPCSNSDRSNAADILKGKSYHLVKSTFPNSLLSLLDNVGSENIVSRTVEKKLFASLTDIRDKNGVSTTSL